MLRVAFNLFFTEYFSISTFSNSVWNSMIFPASRSSISASAPVRMAAFFCPTFVLSSPSMVFSSQASHLV
ncbi:hypothetical protein RCIA191 [Methanocella arvoryzae MRE50]|uniref:Uncharacterized protein n=1 Tax=Methanocella arvoryzae (strain DSM 22066 / NBRC 105507 / MRE50) TaxID=351160 RepID=Q0W1Q2_METAR|nr:hypothetical protein RCIA191 [Methanocella arvoryzae MRE50]